MILVYKNTFSVKKFPVCSLLDYQSTHVCMQLNAPFFIYFTQKKIYIYFPRSDAIKCVFVSDYWNGCIDDILFLRNLLEKPYVIFIISWHCSLRGNFLADTLRYLNWPALSRSWHLAASGMGLGVMSHQAGLLTTLHHIHICFPEQGGNMVTTMSWGFSDFKHLFCFTLMINQACTYHNHIPLMYIFNSPANEFWVSFSLKWSHFDLFGVTKEADTIYCQHRLLKEEQKWATTKHCLTWSGAWGCILFVKTLYICMQIRNMFSRFWYITPHAFACNYVTNLLRWRHNDHDSVSNHQPHGCLLNRLFRRRSK